MIKNEYFLHFFCFLYRFFTIFSALAQRLFRETFFIHTFLFLSFLFKAKSQVLGCFCQFQGQKRLIFFAFCCVFRHKNQKDQPKNHRFFCRRETFRVFKPPKAHVSREIFMNNLLIFYAFQQIILRRVCLISDFCLKK